MRPRPNVFKIIVITIKNTKSRALKKPTSNNALSKLNCPSTCITNQTITNCKCKKSNSKQKHLPNSNNIKCAECDSARYFIKITIMSTIKLALAFM